jgi:hypothetical protein
MCGRHLLLLAATVMLVGFARPAVGADRVRAAELAAAWMTGRFVLPAGVERPVPVMQKHLACGLFEPVAAIDESVLVSEARGIANVVVYAVGEGFPRQPAPPKPVFDYENPTVPDRFVSLQIERWRFDPHVLPFRTSDALSVVNGLDIAANTRIEPPNQDGVNPLLLPEVAVHFRFTTAQPLPIRVSNDIMPWMHAYILPLDHPNFAVSRRDGTFEIKDLPVGREIEFQFWHETKGPVVTKRTPGGRFRMRIKPGENKLGDFPFEP